MPNTHVAQKTWIVAAIAAAITGAAVYALTEKPQPQPQSTAATAVVAEPVVTAPETLPAPAPVAAAVPEASAPPSLQKELASIQKLAKDGFAKQALENVDTLLLDQPEHYAALLTRSQLLLQLERLDQADALYEQEPAF